MTASVPSQSSTVQSKTDRRLHHAVEFRPDLTLAFAIARSRRASGSRDILGMITPSSARSGPCLIRGSTGAMAIRKRYAPNPRRGEDGFGRGSRPRHVVPIPFRRGSLRRARSGFPDFRSLIWRAALLALIIERMCQSGVQQQFDKRGARVRSRLSPAAQPCRPPRACRTDLCLGWKVACRRFVSKVWRLRQAVRLETIFVIV